MFFCGSAPAVSVLVSVHQARVPLLEGDAVDHHDVGQAALSCGWSSWEPPRLQGYRQKDARQTAHLLR